MDLRQSLLLALLSVAVLVDAQEEEQEVEDNRETRIVGGYEITIDKVPWQVSLRSGQSHICGGAIISHLWVLTAAHCTHKKKPKGLSFRAGSTSRKTGGKIYHVEQIVNHAEFDKKKYFNDISMIKSSQRIELGASVAPARLPALGTTHPAPGTTVRATGWGSIGNKGTNVLRAVDITLHDFAYCHKILGISARGTRVCAGDPGKNTCQGDSGGPLVAGDLLVGISSYFLGNTCAQNPHIYSDVAVYRQWIKTNSGV